MITGINESKILPNNISWEYRCRFDGRKWDSDQSLNSNKCWCECKKRNVCEKDYVWKPATCSCENGKYLTSIMKDSTITCDEIIKSYAEEAKTIPTNFAEKKAIFIDYYSIIDSC